MPYPAPLLLPLYLLAMLAGMQWVPPIAQDPAYHAFADQRTWLGIPNFADVSSNLALLLAGLWGLKTAAGAPRSGADPGNASEQHIAIVLFAAVTATAVGSAWYHLAPDNARLFWDRLPLALAFTALPAMLIAERTTIGRRSTAMLALWMLAGPASVVYWHLSELAGAGDLRPYFLLHGFMLVLPPILIALPARDSQRHLLAVAYVLFLLAMAGDFLDRVVFERLGGAVSGHTLKHLLVGLATALLAYRRRVRRRPGAGSHSGQPDPG